MQAEKHTERGAALIIVLGLIAVIAAWAATAAYEDMLSMRQAENAELAAKAELGCLSALSLAQLALKQDARDGKFDSLDDDWAQPAVPFPVDSGLVSGEIIDANRYLNLNDLVDGQGKIVTSMVVVTKRLFALKGVDDSLVDVLVDWMDADNQPFGPSGMEDPGYSAKPYRVKNAALDRMAELPLLSGFNRTVIKHLKDVVTVWPKTSNTQSSMNINTIKADVLLAMFPKMSPSDVESTIAQRPYTRLDGLKNEAWARGKEAQAMFTRLSMSSNHFIVRTHAIFGRADWQDEYGLSRQGEKLTLLWRERLLWQP